MFGSLLTATLVAFLTVAVDAYGKSCPLNYICFALDQSGSINKQEYTKIQEITTKTALLLDNQAPNPTFYAVGFNDFFNIISPPTKNVYSFNDDVNDPVTTSGSTNMYAGVKQCYDYLETVHGNRAIVILSDGGETGTPSAESLVNMKLGSGIEVLTVGIGSSVDAASLRRLASASDFYIPAGYSTSTTIASLLASKVCKAAGMTPDVCAEAYKACDFMFQGRSTVPTYYIGGKPDQAFTDKIVSRSGPPIGVVNMNDIIPEFINKDGTASLITYFGNPRFTPTHFKPYSIRGMAYSSGVGHQTFTGNQLSVARRSLCIRVYFSHYQTLSRGPKPTVLNNVNVEKSDNKCVVFKTS